MIRVVRIAELPPDIQRLREDADLSGVHNMSLLVAEWMSGKQRFDQPGAALFAAFEGEALAGVGGVTRETDPLVSAMRMRRLYVWRDRRKRGIGRMLADTMIAQGFESAVLLTCNARAAPQAADFWEAMGFARVTAENWTHERRRQAPRSSDGGEKPAFEPRFGL